MSLFGLTQFPQVVQRVIVEQCSAQTKEVIQADEIQAVGDSFQALVRSSGKGGYFKNPEVKKQL